MEEAKIDNFNRENPEGSFPKYITLDSGSCADIHKSLSENLRLDVSADSMTLVNEVDRLGEVCEGFNSEDDNFNLKKVLSSLEINWPEYIFINWYRYDNIDKMMLSDLTNHFDDVWYPDVDDIDIFDETFTWVLSITHYGQIKILKI